MSKATPMLQQYMAVKEEYAGCILFFRLGDFYEMFLDDAVTASRELEIVLTSRESGNNERIPMCGIPYHAAAGYLAKLLNKGYKVAICEQVEDPKTAKGIVKREVIRVITPGTVIEEQLLNEKANNYLASFVAKDNFWGLAYVDLSTGEFKTTQIAKTETPLLLNELTRIRPAELYVLKADQDSIPKLNQIYDNLITPGEAQSFHYESAYRILTEHFKVQSLRAFGCEELPAAICAAGAILQYLLETQKNTLLHLRRITTYETGEFMALDPATRRNLELTKNIRSGETGGSLYGVLDQTVTSMGGRLLRAWVEQPLTQIKPIVDRQAAIGELTLNLETREILRDCLQKTYDLQRILSKLASNSANARDLLALKHTLTEIPLIKEALRQFDSGRLTSLRETLQPLQSLQELLESAVKEDPPLSVKDGGMIKTSFHPELARLIDASSQGRRWVAELEQQEKERTGIKSLKVGYNQVFGYYIEVTNSNLSLVPADYIRKQTLANGERFINQALKEYEDLIVNAHEKSIALEYQIFCDLREAVLREIDQLQINAGSLAELDVLVALAETAVRYHYVRPEMNENGKLLIIDGRHPVVERVLPGGKFVPNDTLIDLTEHRIQIITGPNMAGKSTYMRQVALIVLLAHIGSFIPAKSADITVVDRIFTRVGASDDLATGQSTFMVEMNEVAYILNHATAKSLVILDEIGRGTSTFDGLSIAWAVVEFIHNPQRIGCKTLVATHYHELTELAQNNPGIKNYHIAVQRDGEEILFLRKIMPGQAPQSYGIEVARLAGLPGEITGRAKEILATLEEKESAKVEPEKERVKKAEENESLTQLALFPLEKDIILDEIKSIDLVSITPLQALNFIYDWQQKIHRQKQ
jgi:DNA mismatch repair protein MutS